ncbi:MAG: RDD family protein, partial [Candidatus Promineifilaceae bacterium]
FILGPLVGLTASFDSNFLNSISTALYLLWAGLVFLGQFLYFGYFWSRSGQSIGYRWLQLRLVRRQKGDQIGFLRAGLRGSVGYWISGVVFFIGYLWAIWDKNSEAWHDKIFDTWVAVA